VLLKLQQAASVPPHWPCATDGSQGFDPWTGKCEPILHCPPGTVYNPCSRTCAPPGPLPLPPIPACLPGGVYDSCFGACVSNTPCPPPYSYLYDPVVRLCFMPRVSAQALQGSLTAQAFRSLV
jgi:hypothetical protein